MVEFQPPSLIISASSRRSGSTWVQRIVHNATNIFVWGESFPLVELLTSLYGNFKIDAPVRFQETKSFLASDQDPTAWIANINPPFSNLKNAVSSLFSEYYDASLHPHYGWKEVHYGRREIDFLRELFPELRIVLLVRNPVDVIMSLIGLNAIGRWEDTLSVPMVCEYWSARTRDYLLLKDLPNILFLRYEDIHSRVQDLLDFAGGSYNEQVDKAINTKVGGLEKHPILSTKNMRIIFDACHNEMETLGYLNDNLENWGIHPQTISKRKMDLSSSMIEDNSLTMSH